MKVDDLWFDDGNVVVQAEGTRFRVHRSILAARSTFFADLFCLPQPPSASTLDDLPVVELHDKASEVAYFLRAIFDSGFFESPVGSKTKLPIRQIVAVLRLAHKYDVPYLRRRALLHASTIYPRSFEGARATVGIPPCVHFALADVAMEVGAQWLLVVALECCTRMGPECILDGHISPKYDNMHFQLSELAREKCLRAVRDMDQQANQRIVDMFLTPVATCTSRAACMIKRNSIAIALLQKQQAIFVHHMPQARWDDLERVLCDDCFLHVQQADLSWGSAYWAAMPERFGLPPWSELHARRKEDLGLDS
ncbi:hypothetical protein GGG16DRAFT_121378 [Schizophyllum commune]